METNWNCVVVGGGAAGLSAALVLGRARRKTLVVDAGGQSNLPAHGIGGLLGHDGRSPSEFYSLGRDELTKYQDVEFIRGTVEKVTSDEPGFHLNLSDGSKLTTRKIVLASGMEYEVAKLEGLDELWGHTVFHCPFCHGWEVRDRPLAVHGNGDRGFHGALMLRGWSDDVVLLTDGTSEVSVEQLEKLEAAGVRVDERKIDRLAEVGGNLSAIVFSDGNELAREGLLVAPRLHQRNDLIEQLGLTTIDDHPICEDAIQVDAWQRTNLPGVFAAGDQSGQMPQVAGAVASGSTAGAAAVQSLLADDFGMPVPPLEGD